MLLKNIIRLPLRSLRLRLSIAFTLLVAALLVVADGSLIGYAYYTASLRTNRAMERSLVVVQSTLTNEINEARNAPQGTNTGSSTSVLPVAEAVREMEPALAQEGVSVVITDEMGRLWRSARTGKMPRLEPHGASSDGWRIRTLRVLPPDGAAGGKPLTITVGVWWPATEAFLRGQALLLLSLTFFMIFVAGVGAFALIGRTLQPIDRLAQQAREQASQTTRAAGEVLQLTPPSPDAEVVNLVATLNQLLHTVSETAAMKSRFYSAASHELRGPLQVLAGRVELTLGLPRSREEYQAALFEVQEQADHLIGLVQSLLLMNRLEREGTQTRVREFFAIPPLCWSQLDALAPQIRARQLTVGADASLQKMPDIPTASVSHGEILVRNLLDNAVRYTPGGGTIRIASRVLSAQEVALEIVNSSLPLSSVEVARLTEPFYRPDPSRNAQTGGNGLGLSICQTLCNMNGWKLSLCQADGDFHATVAFPITHGGAA